MMDQESDDLGRVMPPISTFYAQMTDSHKVEREEKVNYRPRSVAYMSNQTHNSSMASQVTRELFEAKIEAIEARMDTRVAELGGEIRAYIAEARERDKRMEVIAENSEKAAASASGLKSQMWLACITVVIAVFGSVFAAYFATQSSNIAITQSVISAFQQGQSTPSSKQGK